MISSYITKCASCSATSIRLSCRNYSIFMGYQAGYYDGGAGMVVLGQQAGQYTAGGNSILLIFGCGLGCGVPGTIPNAVRFV